MKYEEKKIYGELIYKGKVVTLTREFVTLANGNEACREVVKHSGGAAVVALTDTDDILLVEQFRYPHKDSLIEIPAGKLEEGETPFETAKRELAEEVGVVVPDDEEWTYLGKILPTPAYDSEITYLFLATGVEYSEKDRRQKLDKDELLDIKKIPFSKAIKQVVNGEISDAKTVAAVLRVYAYIHGGYKLTEEPFLPETPEDENKSQN